MILPVKLRFAKISDLEVLQNLYRETILNSCSKDYNKKQLDAWASSTSNRKRWEAAILEQFFIVAYHKNEILGFGSLKNDGLIDFLYVRESNVKSGIGNLIYLRLEEESRRQNKTVLSAYVSKTAKSFFEKKSFNTLKTNTVIINETELTNYKMAKELVPLSK